MNWNVKLNGEKFKINEIKICVIFECEWKSRQFRGENDEYLSEMSVGTTIY
jgi:hypothetical protein